MINALRIERFKCFESLNLPLSPLTLFSGFNAAGKSTALQTLLLLSQTLRWQRKRSMGLRLKGALTNLGTPADVINRTLGGTELALGISTTDADLMWRFSVGDEGRRSLKTARLEYRSSDSEGVWTPGELDGLRPLVSGVAIASAISSLESLIFLSASRNVETDVFPVPDEDVAFGDVGPLGEFSAWWFHQEADSLVAASRALNKKGDGTLRQQLNMWADDLFPGVEFNAIPILGTPQMRMEIKAGQTSGWTGPSNVGYGVSYTFPTLVAGLIIPDGCTLIVDSPEAHLHPRGQAQLGGFLAQLAAAGIQILVETHSDHVMDGIRIAIRDGILDPRSATFHFFARSESSTSITTPDIDAEGRLSEWPQGFFDQHRRNMARLVRPRSQ